MTPHVLGWTILIRRNAVTRLHDDSQRLLALYNYRYLNRYIRIEYRMATYLENGIVSRTSAGSAGANYHARCYAEREKVASPSGQENKHALSFCLDPITCNLFFGLVELQQATHLRMGLITPH